jgi:heptosyltransferase-1
LTDILFIKASSLGDVIHHMPAVSEARANRPQARLAWLVEEAYAPLVALHPAVGEVIPAWRRWRHALTAPASWREIAASRNALRERRYDAVVDTQGLIRSAVMAKSARGPRHGYDRDSIREPLASLFYDVRHKVSRDLHAVERNRILTGLALGYQPQGAPQYGLDRAQLRQGNERYAMLLHVTARTEKEWPVANWIALGNVLARRGVALVLPWGNEVEQARAIRIAEVIDNARVADRMPLDGMARLIAGAEFVVGVDTGLLHVAAALGVPLVAIFSGSEPSLTRPIGPGAIEVVGAKGATPAVEAVQGALAEILR